MKFGEKGLSFDDVLIVPQFSNVESRSEPNTSSVYFRGQSEKIKVPILSANMDTVTEVNMAIAMRRCGGVGVLHRFAPIERQISMVRKIRENFAPSFDTDFHTPVSVGVKNGESHVDRWLEEGVGVFVIDIAHGHSRKVIDLIRYINACGAIAIAGNVATPDAVKRLENAGAHGIKVGIGPGAACSTRSVAGVGYPQLSAIWNCSLVASVPIIADGGIRTSGDVAKAIAAGASAVMIGSLLAGADESPGATIKKDGKPYKSYRGMASKESQVKRAQLYDIDVDPFEIVAEGESGYVPYSGFAKTVVDQLAGGLRSAMSYVGATSIEEFQKKANFVLTTPSGLAESNVRILI
jgi:IMP dehydrogenase